MGIEDYAGLMETGFESKEPISPEDEFFHSVYIAGVARDNQAGIREEIGKLQIRGVEYNKDDVNMIITHSKPLLAKITREANGRETIECFSYQQGPPPWNGTKHSPCGTNSAERAADPFCKDCRAQLIVAGIHCEANGSPIKNEEGKPVFIFVRGKGMKYSGVSDYLSEVSKVDGLTQIFPGDDEKTRQFERKVVNQKRFVSKIEVGEANSNYGIKKVFTISRGAQIPDENVMEVLKIAQKTLEKFNEKFDWSKGKVAAAAVGYDNLEQIPEASSPQEATPQEAPPKKEDAKQEAFNFEDLSF